MNNLTVFLNDMSLSNAASAKFETLCDLGMPAKQLQSLHDVCSMSLDTVGAYQFLHAEDDLFTAIYGEGEVGSDGAKSFVFPFVKGKQIPDGIREVCGPIGTQTSKWHQENLQQHAALVAANAVDAGIKPTMAVALAVLHDIGKKYTAATNKFGCVCFYGHAKVSAFIVTHWLRNWKHSLSSEMARDITLVVYAHMFPHDTWNVTTHWKTGEPVDYRGDFYKELQEYLGGDKAEANRIMALIDIFEKCDVGVEDAAFSEEIKQQIKRGEDLILNTVVCS